MFFSMFGPPSIQLPNIVDNKYYKWQVYELFDSSRLVRSDLKMIPCPKEIKDRHVEQHL